MAICWKRNLTFEQDPDATLDYQLDCSEWLPTGDTLSSPTVSAASGITVDSYSNDDDTITAWISGGTTGQTYTITYHIVTTGGREDDKSIRIRIKES